MAVRLSRTGRSLRMIRLLRMLGAEHSDEQWELEPLSEEEDAEATKKEIVDEHEH